MEPTRAVMNNNDSFSNPVFTDPVELPGLAGICEAHSRLPGCVKNTPLFRSEALSELFDADVWIKNETVSPVASFKIRGALTALIRSGRRGEVFGAVTSSTGNHGQGVAYAARLLGIPAHIFLPENPNPLKRRGIQMLGASVHRYGYDIDDAKKAARRFANGKGYVFVDDGESLHVIEGAGTVGLEVARSLKNIDAVFVPMGSGSLAGGSAAAIKSLQPETKVIAIQSYGAPAMVKSVRARAAVSHPINTAADGLVCREPSLLALKGLLAFVDEAELVADEELLGGVSALAETARCFVELSGAAAFAGAWKRRREIARRRVVLILTGANITADAMRQALNSRSTPPAYSRK